MAMEALVLVANPGSASRKYGLFLAGRQLVHLHFEYEEGEVYCTVATPENSQRQLMPIKDIKQSTGTLRNILLENGLLKTGREINRIGLRVVAPSGYFLRDHILNKEAVEKLEELKYSAPLHIVATLDEFGSLSSIFPSSSIVGISDSAFHINKPDYAWNYGLPLEDADRLEIKRYGYHGLSISSAVRKLKSAGLLRNKVIVCHLGSGASVTAVLDGRSIDTTMGYSPLEGLIMATRSGSLDPGAVQILKNALGLNDYELDQYLNLKSGLLGLSGTSSDIRELLKHEKEGNYRARLALNAYVYNAQKAIGQMAAVLGGADDLVFTGTVGERSAIIRQKILSKLNYLGFYSDDSLNEQCNWPDIVTSINDGQANNHVYVVPINESEEIAHRVASFTED